MPDTRYILLLIHNVDTNIDKEFLLTPFSKQGYREAIAKLKIRSSSGPDLISNKIIKKFPEELHLFILKIFNLIFNKSTYPQQWSDYFVIFIPKPGRRDSLRPISLANNLFKIFEKLIHRRIVWWAKNSSILCNTQFGFKKRLSCIDSITTLTTSIQIANKAQKYTGVTFLDLVGAFDRIRPEILITLLDKYGLPPKILRFIATLVTRRNLIGFAAGINLQNRTTTIGLPQGSILNPILFNLYIALSHTVIPDSVKIRCYADNIAIYCSDQHLDYIKNQLNIALDNLYQFFTDLGLEISPSKYSFTIFSSLKPRNLVNLILW